MFKFALEKFINFVNNNYDMNDTKVSHKLNHTLHVVSNAKFLCEKMCKNLKLHYGQLRFDCWFV